MVFQNNTALRPALKSIGCEFLCCCAIIERHLRIDMTVERINGFHDTLRGAGLLDDSLGLHRSASYNRLFALANTITDLTSWSGDQVGMIKLGSVIFWDWWHSTQFTDVIERGILLTGVRHVRLRNADFQIVYDSAPWVSWGETESYMLMYFAPTTLFRGRT